MISEFFKHLKVEEKKILLPMSHDSERYVRMLEKLFPVTFFKLILQFKRSSNSNPNEFKFCHLIKKKDKNYAKYI